MFFLVIINDSEGRQQGTGSPGCCWPGEETEVSDGPWQAVPGGRTRRQLLSPGEAVDICGEGRNSYPTPKQKSRTRAMPSLRKFVILSLVGRTAG